MRRAISLTVIVVVAVMGAGCLIDRGPLGGNTGLDVGTERPDAWIAETTDAPPPDANADAWLDPATDAWEPDAFAETPDANVGPMDAWSPPGTDAWAPDAWAADAAMCSGPRCEGPVLVDCAGTRTSCVVCGTTAALPAPHCLELVPSNVPGSFTFPRMALATDVVVSAEVTWDTGDCDRDGLPVGDGTARADMMSFSHPDQPGSAGEVCIFAANSFTFTGTANVHVVGTRPLILLANDRIDVGTGAIVSVASVDTPALTDCAILRTGAGSGTGGNPGVDGRTNDSGGGGGGFCGAGGVGGNGGSAIGGEPGAATPSATLVPLLGGADGGDGAGGSGNFGGPGGGALQISARRVSIRGRVEAFGAGGGGGEAMHAGGAGGSGGGVHVEALVLDVLGGSVDVRGGAGGGGGCGGRGQCGLQNAAPASMVGGASDGTCAGAGGGGAGMMAIDGAAGGSADFNGGGGGGGAGCVVVRQYASSAVVPTYPAGSAVLRTAPVTVR